QPVPISQQFQTEILIKQVLRHPLQDEVKRGSHVVPVEGGRRGAAGEVWPTRCGRRDVADEVLPRVVAQKLRPSGRRSSSAKRPAGMSSRLIYPFGQCNLKGSQGGFFTLELIVCSNGSR